MVLNLVIHFTITWLLYHHIVSVSFDTFQVGIELVIFGTMSNWAEVFRFYAGHTGVIKLQTKKRKTKQYKTKQKRVK